MLFFTPEEFNKFLSVESELRFRVAFQILFYCGLRNGELRGLTWNDINFNKRTLTVNKNIVKAPDVRNNKPYSITSPKTSSCYRTIPIPNFLLNDLERLYDDSSNFYHFKDNWFVIGDIDPMPKTTLRDRKSNNTFNAEVKDIRIHDFRHSCASLLIDNGANITLVAKYLGHSKIDETLNTYSHMYQTRLDSIVSILEQQNEDYLSYQEPIKISENKIIETRSIDGEIVVITKKKNNKEKDELNL